MSNNPTRLGAVLTMHYVEGWLSACSDDEWCEPASKYLREHIGEIADQMVEDHCADFD